MRKKPMKEDDLYVCKRKIEALLVEFNCVIESADQWHSVILTDSDTGDSTNIARSGDR